MVTSLPFPPFLLKFLRLSLIVIFGFADTVLPMVPSISIDSSASVSSTQSPVVLFPSVGLGSLFDSVEFPVRPHQLFLQQLTVDVSSLPVLHSAAGIDVVQLPVKFRPHTASDFSDSFVVVVAGSREGVSRTDVRFHMSLLHRQWGPFVVVAGGAPGVDRFGEQLARDAGVLFKVMPADWDRFKRAAGYIRNDAMAKAADAALVLWDGLSPGSAHMIRVAAARGLQVRVVAPFSGLQVLIESAPASFDIVSLAGVEWLDTGWPS